MSDHLHPHSPKGRKLLQELQILEDMLLNSNPSSSADSDSEALALVKVFKDISHQEWENMSKNSGIDPGWMPLPVNREKFSTLLSLSSTIENLARSRDIDPLSGLKNRGFFERVLARELEKSLTYKVPLTLAIIDIDDFKKINDQLGHVCGDEVIRNFSEILASGVRGDDHACRIGGEEFALILPGTGMVKSRPLLERIMETVRESEVYCDSGRSKTAYTVSIGSVTYRGQGKLEPEAFLALADEQLYKVKQSGKDSLATVSASQVIDDTSMVGSDEKNFLLKG